eukprot:541664-Amphidinium_carterae.1
MLSADTDPNTNTPSWDLVSQRLPAHIVEEGEGARARCLACLAALKSQHEPSVRAFVRWHAHCCAGPSVPQFRTALPSYESAELSCIVLCVEVKHLLPDRS